MIVPIACASVSRRTFSRPERTAETLPWGVTIAEKPRYDAENR